MKAVMGYAPKKNLNVACYATLVIQRWLRSDPALETAASSLAGFAGPLYQARVSASTCVVPRGCSVDGHLEKSKELT